MKVIRLAISFKNMDVNQLIDQAALSIDEAKKTLRFLESENIPTQKAAPVIEAVVAKARAEWAFLDKEFRVLVLRLIRKHSENVHRSILKALSDILYSVRQEEELSILVGIAGGDKSGMYSAMLFMMAETDSSVIASACNRFGIKGNANREELAKRTSIVENMSQLEDMGYSWDNETSGNAMLAIAQQTNWSSNIIKEMSSKLGSYPVNYLSAVLDNAPEDIKNSTIKNALQVAKTAIQFMSLVTQRWSSSEDILSSEWTTAVKNFFNNPNVPLEEMTSLYEYAIAGNTLGISELAIDITREYAQLEIETCFNIALNSAKKGYVTPDFLNALTGNLRFSLDRRLEIAKILDKYQAWQHADTTFKNFVAVVEDKNVPTDQLENLFDNDDTFAETIEMIRTGSFKAWDNLSVTGKAVMSAFILMTIGVSTWASIGGLGVTKKDLEENSHLAAQAKEIVAAASSDPESKRMVEEAIAAAKAMPDVVLSKPGRKYQPKVYRFMPFEITADVVQAVIDLEYDPRKEVSSQGATGRMQIMPKTWDELNQKHFNGKYPFSKHALDPKINQMFGTQYLKDIKAYLDARQELWQADGIPLLLACYFGGIGNIRKCDFDPAKIAKRLPKTFDYMTRGCNLIGHPAPSS